MASEQDVIDRLRASVPDGVFDVAIGDIVSAGRRRRSAQRGAVATAVVAVALAVVMFPLPRSDTTVAGLTVFEAEGHDVIGLFIPSVSMSPTLRPGDVAAVDVNAYHDLGPARGDIVVFTDPTSDCATVFVKRVAGLPGDTVEQVDGTILVNGEPLDGPERDRNEPDLGPWTVRPGHLFVVGDNLSDSNDSRRDAFGQVAEDDVIGRVDLSIDLERADVPAPPACVVSVTNGQ
jgi:signal peptidase I